MLRAGVDTVILCDNANLYYLTGRVFSGFAIYNVSSGLLRFFVKRPVNVEGDEVSLIHKPEQIPAMLADLGVSDLGCVAMELDSVSFSMVRRLSAAFSVASEANADALLRGARSVKTPLEQDLMRRSGICQERVYATIPKLYHRGMTDIGLQIEIERALRLEGCLGIFRVAGNDMELHMGSLLVGDNADAPSPYDFAMGGAGADPSLPVGADGTVISPGHSVMVDVNGNFTGYMTDMTRTFAVGELPRMAYDAHELSCGICRELAVMGRPGVPARDLYERAFEMARDAGFEDYFMGHRQHAGFVGHGVGIVVNELPVIAPRSKDVLAAGNVIALEPKFVIPHVGAVGIENTYIVQPSGPMQCITNAPEQILSLCD